MIAILMSPIHYSSRYMSFESSQPRLGFVNQNTWHDVIDGANSITPLVIITVQCSFQLVIQNSSPHEYSSPQAHNICLPTISRSLAGFEQLGSTSTRVTSHSERKCLASPESFANPKPWKLSSAVCISAGNFSWSLLAETAVITMCPKDVMGRKNEHRSCSSGHVTRIRMESDSMHCMEALQPRGGNCVQDF